MTRSLRARLAARFAFTMAIGTFAVAAVGWMALRYVLDQAIDSSLLNVASIQAASVTDSPDGVMRFHEWELTPEEAVSVRDLNRYAQVWDRTGHSLLRTRYITEDLPLDTLALDRAEEGGLTWTRQSFDGIPIRSLYYPLERQGALHEGHVLQVAAPLEARDQTLRATALYLAAIWMLVVAGTWVGAWWLGGSSVKPVHAIIDQAEEIEGGTLDRRISAYAEIAEYRRLVSVLNTMLDRLQDSFQAQRRFTADASHELRSPLTAMRGELEVALRRPREGEEYQEVLRSSLEEVNRLSRLSDDLLTLARTDSGELALQRVEAPLGRAVSQAVGRVGAMAREKGVEMGVDGIDEGDLPLSHDPDLLVRLVWNLVDNALAHTPPGGRVQVVLRKDGPAHVLEVHDTGPGVPSEHRSRIFERFYRVDEARSHAADGSQGTGLGLPIAKAIAEAHGGAIQVGDSPLGGALFTVHIPD